MPDDFEIIETTNDPEIIVEEVLLAPEIIEESNVIEFIFEDGTQEFIIEEVENAPEIIEEIRGQDGSTWITGNGSPTAGIGLLNDLYLDVGNGNVYKKTAISSWTYQMNITGPTGIGIGVPGGGSTHQLLRKIDGSDYNTEWTDDMSLVNALIFG